MYLYIYVAFLGTSWRVDCKGPLVGEGNYWKGVKVSSSPEEKKFISELDQAKFFSPALLTFWARPFFAGEMGDHAVHCRVFKHISGLFSLDICSITHLPAQL